MFTSSVCSRRDYYNKVQSGGPLSEACVQVCQRELFVPAVAGKRWGVVVGELNNR